MQDFGKLLLRLMVGGLMLTHGIAKIQHGIGGSPGIIESVTNKGLPEFIAWGVYIGEVAAPALLILGLFTRISAIIVAVNMAVAVWLAHPNDLMKFDDRGSYALEIQAFYLISALAIACLGGGRFAVSKKG